LKKLKLKMRRYTKLNVISRAFRSRGVTRAFTASANPDSEFVIDPNKPLGDVLITPLSRPKPASQVLVNHDPTKRIKMPVTPPMSDPILTMGYAKRLFPHEFANIIKETKAPDELMEVYHMATKKEGRNPRKRIQKFEAAHARDFLTQLHRLNQGHFNPRWKLIYEHNLIQLYKQTHDFLLFYTPRDLSQIIFVLGKGFIRNEEEKNLLDHALVVFLNDEEFPLADLGDLGRVLVTLSDMRRQDHPVFKKILKLLPKKLEEIPEVPGTIKSLARIAEALSFSNTRDAKLWEPMIEHMTKSETLANAEILEGSQFLLAMARCNPKCDWKDKFGELVDWCYEQALAPDEEKAEDSVEAKTSREEDEEEDADEDEEADEEDDDGEVQSWADPERETRRFCRAVVNITEALTFPQRKVKDFRRHRWFTDETSNILKKLSDQENLEDLRPRVRETGRLLAAIARANPDFKRQSADPSSEHTVKQVKDAVSRLTTWLGTLNNKRVATGKNMIASCDALARLGIQNPRFVEQALDELSSEIDEKQIRLTSRDITTVLVSLAQAGFEPKAQRQVVDQLLKVACGIKERYSADELVNSLWAVAALNAEAVESEAGAEALSPELRDFVTMAWEELGGCSVPRGSMVTRLLHAHLWSKALGLGGYESQRLRLLRQRRKRTRTIIPKAIRESAETKGINLDSSWVDDEGLRAAVTVLRSGGDPELLVLCQPPVSSQETAVSKGGFRLTRSLLVRKYGEDRVKTCTKLEEVSALLLSESDEKAEAAA